MRQNWDGAQDALRRIGQLAGTGYVGDRFPLNTDFVEQAESAITALQGALDVTTGSRDKRRNGCKRQPFYVPHDGQRTQPAAK